MLTLVTIVHIIASVILIITVLLQVGKGADMGSAFGGGGSQTLFGSAGPTTFLAKLCIACAAVFMITSMYLTYSSSKSRTASIVSTIPAVSPIKPADKTQGAQPSVPPVAPQPAQK